MSKIKSQLKGKREGNGTAILERKSATIKAAKGASRKSPEASAAKEKGTSGSSAGSSKRKLGLRGAAPWAARHAAKHAAEARARAASPPPPGSARATIRVPSGAEEIKAKIAELHNLLVQIRASRKNLAKGFFDVGTVLREVQEHRLYQAKGYGSFEAFLEREIDLGKVTALRLVRISTTFQKDAALEFGMDRVLQAMQSLETPAEPVLKSGPLPGPNAQFISKFALPLKPPALGRVG